MESNKDDRRTASRMEERSELNTERRRLLGLKKQRSSRDPRGEKVGRTPRADENHVGGKGSRAKTVQPNQRITGVLPASGSKGKETVEGEGLDE